MQIRKLTLRWTPGAIFQVWQKREGQRSIAFGSEVEIDDVPVEDVHMMHAAFAAALDLPCRPRTYEEMLAGHTRDGLALLTGKVEVWVLTVTDEGTLGPREDTQISVHATERDAEDALRVNYAAEHQHLEGEALRDLVESQGIHVTIDRHSILA